MFYSKLLLILPLLVNNGKAAEDGDGTINYYGTSNVRDQSPPMARPVLRPWLIGMRPVRPTPVTAPAPVPKPATQPESAQPPIAKPMPVPQPTNIRTALIEVPSESVSSFKPGPIVDVTAKPITSRTTMNLYSTPNLSKINSPTLKPDRTTPLPVPVPQPELTPEPALPELNPALAAILQLQPVPISTPTPQPQPATLPAPPPEFQPKPSIAPPSIAPPSIAQPSIAPSSIAPPQSTPAPQPEQPPITKPVPIPQPTDSVTPLVEVVSESASSLKPVPSMNVTDNPISSPTTNSPTPTPNRTTPKLNNTTLKPIQTLEDYSPCREGNGYYAVSNECDGYFECRKYVPEKRSCPDGLHFKPDAVWPEYACGYPFEVRCANGTETQPAKPTAQCPRQYGYYHMNDGDCSRYIMCQAGMATIMSCPLGLAFNPDKNSCDWPENVPRCNPNAFKDFVCPPPPLERDGSPSDIIYKYRYFESCNAYVACQRGFPRLLTCDVGLYFDQPSQACIDKDYVTDCAAPKLQ